MKHPILIGLLALAACADVDEAPQTGSIAQAIVNGQDDDGHPAVIQFPGGCSGTLIAPRVILTAAHCAGPPQPTLAFFGAVPGGPGKHVPIAEWTVHPSYVITSLDHDIALVRLGEPAPVAPVPIRREPLSPRMSGGAVSIVGFGVGNDRAPRRKRAGTATLTSFDATTMTLDPRPSTNCIGDSGGATFTLEGDLIGVTSRGDPHCRAFGIGVRVDAYTSSFIQPYLDEQERLARGADSDGCSASRGPQHSPITPIIALGAAIAWRRRRFRENSHPKHHGEFS